MKIEVNASCLINQENIAPSVEDRLVAINVTNINDESDKFINYTLAIDNDGQCCEWYGAELFLFNNKQEEYFVNHIEHDTDDKNVINQLRERLKSITTQPYEIDDILSNAVISAVYGKNNKLLAIGVCWNYHNGYYAHEVFADINGNTNVELL